MDEEPLKHSALSGSLSAIEWACERARRQMQQQEASQD